MFACDTEDLDAIRDGVRSLCSHYDTAYWRDIDERKAFPEEFVEALTEAAGWRR